MFYFTQIRVLDTFVISIITSKKNLMSKLELKSFLVLNPTQKII